MKPVFMFLYIYLQPVIHGYLVDYGLDYDTYCNYMSIDGVWGDLVVHYILTKLLLIAYTTLTPCNEVRFNKDKSTDNPHQYDIVIAYNGKNHYVSTCK